MDDGCGRSRGRKQPDAVPELDQATASHPLPSHLAPTFVPTRLYSCGNLLHQLRPHNPLCSSSFPPSPPCQSFCGNLLHEAAETKLNRFTEVMAAVKKNDADTVRRLLPPEEAKVRSSFLSPTRSPPTIALSPVLRPAPPRPSSPTLASPAPFPPLLHILTPVPSPRPSPPPSLPSPYLRILPPSTTPCFASLHPPLPLLHCLPHTACGLVSDPSKHEISPQIHSLPFTLPPIYIPSIPTSPIYTSPHSQTPIHTSPFPPLPDSRRDAGSHRGARQVARRPGRSHRARRRHGRGTWRAHGERGLEGGAIPHRDRKGALATPPPPPTFWPFTMTLTLEPSPPPVPRRFPALAERRSPACLRAACS